MICSTSRALSGLPNPPEDRIVLLNYSLVSDLSLNEETLDIDRFRLIGDLPTGIVDQDIHSAIPFCNKVKGLCD
jgi:hypothetical protein